MSIQASHKHVYDPVQATPVAFAQAVLRAYEKYGVSAVQALEHAQITPAQLHDAQGRITALQMERLSAYAMRELDDEALGWFSQRMRWGSYGMLLRASLTSPTLGVAMQRWCRHHGLLTQDVLLRWHVRPEGVAAAVLEQGAGVLGEFREFCLVSILRNLHGVACWLVDSQIALQRIELGFDAPAYADALRLMFPGPIHFGAAQTSLHLDAAYLSMPVRRSEADLNEMLRRALYVMVKPYRRDRLMLRKVRQLLRGRLASVHAQPHTAQSLAQELHMSVRSLHRFLQEEGTSLQAIKNEVRRERATELLMRTRHPIKQIAGMAGFENVKSFSRAFLHWTGKSPQQFRNDQGLQK